MKAVSQIITLVIIIVIAISLVTLLWLFISEYYISLTSSGESTINETLIVLSSCMKIDSVSGNKLFLRNCGKGSITEDTLKVYLDEEPVDFSMDPSIYKCSNADEYSTITVSCPNGLVISSIEDSVYVDRDSPASCSNPDPAGYSCNGYCYYADNCIGKNSCSFDVINDNCVDPCPGQGIDKKLILNVGCGGKTIIDEDEVGTVTLYDLWGLSLGEHLLKATNPKATAEMLVESVLPDSCVLALDFDEGGGTIAYDKSGYGNDGILLPVGSEPNWVDGKFDKALEFDNENDCVNISNDESLNLTNSLTVAAWVYPRGWGEGSYGKIILKATGCCGSDGYMIYMSDLWDTLVLKLGTSYYDDRINLFIGFNEWQHMLANFNSTHVSFYKNGIGFNPVSRTIPIPTNNKPVYIGNSEDLDRTFDGIIDSVRIYNKALTPDETIILKPVTYD